MFYGISSWLIYFSVFGLIWVFIGIFSGKEELILVIAIHGIFSISTLYDVLNNKTKILLKSIHIKDDKLHINFLSKNNHKFKILNLNEVEIVYNKATWGFWNITGVTINNKDNKVLRQSVLWKIWSTKNCKDLVEWWEENKAYHRVQRG